MSDEGAFTPRSGLVGWGTPPQGRPRERVRQLSPSQLLAQLQQRAEQLRAVIGSLTGEADELGSAFAGAGALEQERSSKGWASAGFTFHGHIRDSPGASPMRVTMALDGRPGPSTIQGIHTLLLQHPGSPLRQRPEPSPTHQPQARTRLGPVPPPAPPLRPVAPRRLGTRPPGALAGDDVQPWPASGTAQYGTGSQSPSLPPLAGLKQRPSPSSPSPSSGSYHAWRQEPGRSYGPPSARSHYAAAAPPWTPLSARSGQSRSAPRASEVRGMRRRPFLPPGPGGGGGRMG